MLCYVHKPDGASGAWAHESPKQSYDYLLLYILQHAILLKEDWHIAK
ncbi:hypothetical protein EVA_03527 [gut metagenome]|uniref:Uncharacterized protein n=1 Tax=gut metagenome TaxID=749906 RepID=J9GLM9_9ZZZZ